MAIPPGGDVIVEGPKVLISRPKTNWGLQVSSIQAWLVALVLGYLNRTESFRLLISASSPWPPQLHPPTTVHTTVHTYIHTYLHPALKQATFACCGHSHHPWPRSISIFLFLLRIVLMTSNSRQDAPTKGPP